MKTLRQLNESSFFIVFRAYQGMVEKVEQRLLRFQLNLLQALTLLALYIESSPAYPGDLAKLLGRSKSSISLAIAVLEERQWVKRSLVPHDRRHFKLKITPEGKTMAKQLLRFFNVAEQGLENTLSLKTLTQLKKQNQAV